MKSRHTLSKDTKLEAAYAVGLGLLIVDIVNQKARLLITQLYRSRVNDIDDMPYLRVLIKTL